LRQQIQRGEVLELRAPDQPALNTVTALVSRMFWSGCCRREITLARNRGIPAMMFPDSKNIQPT